MTEAPGPLEGRTFNGYEILSRLGAGGMGVVYRALDTRLQRTVALKFLPQDVVADDRAREMFLQEARAASMLDHPNVGTIHSIEESAGGQRFIVMAYYEGETLAQKLRSGPLPVAEALEIAIQVAKGLGAAHARDVVHRDVKPSNVILTQEGLAKIVDFGLARVIHSASSTQTAAVAGTVSYMSPEQATAQPVDRRTDLWSLGVTLYAMLTGRLPFEADSAPAVLFAIVHQAPREMDATVPAGVQKIVYRALAKNREERYGSAAEMLRDMQEAARAVSAMQEAPTVTVRELSRYREMASGGVTATSKAGLLSSARARAISVTLSILVAAAVLVPPVRQRVLRTFGGPQARHIAVLPLTTIGTNPEDAALADGLMESLTSKLSNLQVGNQALWVVPASEVRRLKITDPTAARRKLAANLVVSGALQRDGQGVRLVVNLIDTSGPRQIGSGEFEDRGGDFSAIQDSAVAKLANLMDIPITREMLHNTGGSVMPAAYEQYLEALGDIQRYDKPGNLDQALQLLQKAVQADPNFALAYASMGEAYVVRFQLDRNPKWLDEAEANCRRALKLNDQLAPVHVTMGRIQDRRGHQDLALEEFQRALTLEPHSAEALFGIAGAYENMGRIREAEEIYQRAAALRPDYWEGYNRLGTFYRRQKRWEDAMRQFERANQLAPDNVAPYINMGATLIDEGKLGQAAPMLEKATQLAPSYGIYANLGQIYYRQRKYAEAARATEQALKLNDKDYRVWINLAAAYAWLNRPADEKATYERALPMVETAARNTPQNAGIQAQLAEVYAHLGRRDQALQRLETALALAPGDLDTQEVAAEVHELTGDHAKAVRIAAEAVRKGYSLEALKKNHDLQKVITDPQFPFKH